MEMVRTERAVRGTGALMALIALAVSGVFTASAFAVATDDSAPGKALIGFLVSLVPVGISMFGVIEAIRQVAEARPRTPIIVAALVLAVVAQLGLHDVAHNIAR